jgi:hypothetical protein
MKRESGPRLRARLTERQARGVRPGMNAGSASRWIPERLQPGPQQDWDPDRRNHVRGAKSRPSTARSAMAQEQKSKPGWLERRRERKRLKRERTGDSSAKLAEGHAPGETAVGRMLRLGGVDRESRFKDG